MNKARILKEADNARALEVMDLASALLESLVTMLQEGIDAPMAEGVQAPGPDDYDSTEDDERLMRYLNGAITEIDEARDEAVRGGWS